MIPGADDDSCVLSLRGGLRGRVAGHGFPGPKFSGPRRMRYAIPVLFQGPAGSPARTLLNHVGQVCAPMASPILSSISGYVYLGFRLLPNCKASGEFLGQHLTALQDGGYFRGCLSQANPDASSRTRFTNSFLQAGQSLQIVGRAYFNLSDTTLETLSHGFSLR